MTRKDYQLIANTFKRHLESMEKDSFKNETLDESLRRLILAMGIDLKDDNDRFNLEIFWKACGL